MAARQVECKGCGKKYLHAFPNQMVCPGCGCADYSGVSTSQTESAPRRDRHLTEQAGPKLLTEDEPLPPIDWNR